MTAFIAGGWGLFLGENIILSENREWLIQRYGDENYHLGYNTLSSFACGSILYGFFKHRGTGPRWAFAKGAPPARCCCRCCLAMSWPGRFFAAVPAAASRCDRVGAWQQGGAGHSVSTPKQDSVVLGLAPRSQKSADHTPASSGGGNNIRFKARCPMDFRAKRDVKDGDVYGVERVSRHANLWSLASLGVGTALLTPFVVESFFFAGPLALASVGTWHQDSRFRRGLGGTLTPDMESKTSNIPFAALLMGRQDWGKLWNEFKGLNALVPALVHRRCTSDSLLTCSSR